MGNRFSSRSQPPQLYARHASAPDDYSLAERATLERLKARYPAKHSRDVDPALLATPAFLGDGLYLGSFEHARNICDFTGNSDLLYYSVRKNSDL